MLVMNSDRLAKLLLWITGLVLAFGRWATQIWIGPFPIMDLFIQSLILTAISIYGFRLGIYFSESTLKFLNFSLLLIYGYSVLKIASGVMTGNYPINLIIRDEMSFFVIGEIIFFCCIFQNIFSDKDMEMRLEKMFIFVGMVSFLQCAASLLFTDLHGWEVQFSPMEFQANLFSVRSDQFATAVSPLIATSIYNITSRKRLFINLALLFMTLLLIFAELPSRAVLISTLLTLVLSWSISNSWKKKTPAMNALKISITVLISPFIFLMLSTLISFQRLLSGLGLKLDSSDTSPILNGAIGTQSARQQAWTLILNDWSNSYLLNGYPAGYHFIKESGALFFLSGSEDVRWPNNFFISCLVRNGIFFGVILIVCCITLVYVSFLNTKLNSRSLLDLQIMVLQVSTILVSCFGVVLESPFGYLPFAVASSISIVRYRLSRRNHFYA